MFNKTHIKKKQLLKDKDLLFTNMNCTTITNIVIIIRIFQFNRLVLIVADNSMRKRINIRKILKSLQYRSTGVNIENFINITRTDKSDLKEGLGMEIGT